MKEMIHVRQTSDISAACEWAENRLIARREKVEDARICALIQEEILRRLLTAGLTELTVLTAGCGTAHIEILAPGPENDLTETPGKTDTERLETEIQSHLLEQFAPNILRDYHNGRNRYRIYPSKLQGAELKDEIFTYYQTATAKGNARPFGVIRHIAKKHPAMAVFAVVNRTVKHLCALLLPVFASNIIEALSTCASFFDPIVLWNILGSALSLTINLVCATMDARIYQRFARNVESGFKLAMVQKLQVLSMKYYSETPSGTVLSKLVSDVQFVKMLLCEQFQTVLHPAIDVVFVIIVSLRKLPVMLAFYAVVIPAACLLIRHHMKPIRESKTRMRRKNEYANASFKEMLAMERLNRSHGLHKAEYRSISSKVWDVQISAIEQDRLQVRLNNAGYAAAQGFRLLCLCVAVYLAFRGMITVGAVVLFLSLFDTLINSIQKLLDEMPQITQDLDSLSSINEVLLETDIEKNGTKRLPAPIRGDVEFRNVSFRYDPDKPDTLKEVSFKIPAGTSAALIGQSGSGKTTVLNLLLGLYAAESGSIEIDGIDINDLDKDNYRQHIAVVPQSPMLFSGTLWDNMVYGLQYVPVSQVQKMLKSVALDTLVTEHPDGLMRPILEGGENLSGGQRQRVAIARALLRDPKIILFDEATSALDAESEQEVQKAIDAIMHSCTVLIVAHRLNTIRKVDQIFRIEDGRAVPCDRSQISEAVDTPVFED